ncbi:unnamed protein product [Allacma fusca]|uniref:Uncharacterized protein n=1 Tax=Allacma fusca TaxID=39272 RepID=A0A8J2PK76_9HEXA|nr:unnamed protein product [Allacma fusca]
MASFAYLILCSLLLFYVNCQELNVNKNLGESNYKEAIFTYPPQILSERDIPVCANEKDELIACNVVNQRYFYPPTIERLCRCPDRSECPWEFSEYKTVQRKEGRFKKIADQNTVMLSSRSQLKFCNEVSSLEKCTKSLNETALKVVFMEPNVRRILTQCHCPAFKRWILISDDSKEFSNGTILRTLSYSCDKLPKCNEGELCGHVRQDTYSTYFLCSCPLKTLCYPPNMKDVYNVSELFYTGPAIKAYCVKT